MADNEVIRDRTGRLECSCPDYAKPTVNIALDRSRVGLSVEVCDAADPFVPKGAIYALKRLIVEGDERYVEQHMPHRQTVYLDRDGFILQD